jgi:Flp pilus assembly pilin Flp
MTLKWNAVRETASGLWRDETAQDLLEYTLLLAFVALAGAAAFLGMNSSINTLWSVANNNLAAGNAAGNGS